MATEKDLERRRRRRATYSPQDVRITACVRVRLGLRTEGVPSRPSKTAD